MKRVIGSVFLCIAFTFSAFGQAWNYESVVVFGDSLSDTGNSFANTGIPPSGPGGFPYFEGRFSNGPIWIDFLQQSFQFSDSQVLNFAVGGASTGFGFLPPPDGIFDVPPGTQIPTVGTQIGIYLQTDLPRDNQLFILWAGSNDLFNGQFPSVAAANLEEHVRTLAAAGADEFLIPNLAPIGDTPAVSGTFEGLLLNYFAFRFNRKLDRRLDRLENELGITIHRLDTFTLTLIGSFLPQLFGFTNTDDAALIDVVNGVITPAEGATYLFWDIIHPTSLTHSIIAGEALRVLSE